MAIPALATRTVIATSVAVGSAFLSMVWSVSNRMKHTTSITNLMNLSKGDHISLRNKRNQPFIHAIVVKAVKAPEDKVEVIFCIRSKSSVQIEFMEVDLCREAVNQELDRHHYEGLVCYPAKAVVDRAKSLCPQFISPDKSEVVGIYWPFFRDDEHFANWCQTGFCFRDCMKAAMVKNYAMTPLYDLASLREGRPKRRSTCSSFSSSLCLHFTQHIHVIQHVSEHSHFID